MMLCSRLYRSDQGHLLPVVKKLPHGNQCSGYFKVIVEPQFQTDFNIASGFKNITINSITMLQSSRIICVFVLIVFTSHSCWAQQSHLMNELSSGPDADELENRVGWMETAKNALAAPAGQMAVHFAKELISRSAGNSQVC